MLDSVTRFVWVARSGVYHRAKFDVNVHEDGAVEPVGAPFMRARCNISDAAQPRRAPLEVGDEPPEERRGCKHCTRGSEFPS